MEGWTLAKRLIHGIDDISQKGFFRDLKTKARYRRVYGGIGWPSVHAPGCAVILAEELFKDHEAGKRRLRILETVQDADPHMLLDKISIMQESMCRVDWYGNTESSWTRILPKQNNRLFDERKAGIKLFKPPAFDESDRMGVYSQLLKIRTGGGIKTFFFDGSSAANDFAQVVGEMEEDRFPGAAAVLYALAAMDFRRVTE